MDLRRKYYINKSHCNLIYNTITINTINKTKQKHFLRVYKVMVKSYSPFMFGSAFVFLIMGSWSVFMGSTFTDWLGR